MSVIKRPKIPVNIIAGPLGVGKTTVINHLLQHRPTGERWAVLVNEYGLVGLDAALIQGDGASEGPKGVEIREVAGGCICCSAGLMFDVSLTMLLQRRPARLLIEPTGLAALSGILDTLDRPGIREAVDVRSVVCLLNPSRFRDDIVRDQVLDQIEAADVLLASKADQASSSELEDFYSWANALFPPRQFVGQVAQGKVPLHLLDVVSDRSVAAPRGGHAHGTDHHHHDNSNHSKNGTESVDDEVLCDASHPFLGRSHRSSVASTAGWICWGGLEFDARRIYRWLTEVAQLPGSLRTKAVLRTNEGWWSFNFADGFEDLRPSGYRRDSRLEMIFEGEDFPAPDSIEAGLRACLSD